MTRQPKGNDHESADGSYLTRPLGSTGRKTGFWLEELAAPYYMFRDTGAHIVLASPKGGLPPLDPEANEPANRTDLRRRFESDADAMAQLASTVRLEQPDDADISEIILRPARQDF